MGFASALMAIVYWSHEPTILPLLLRLTGASTVFTTVEITGEPRAADAFETAEILSDKSWNRCSWMTSGKIDYRISRPYKGNCDPGE